MSDPLDFWTSGLDSHLHCHAPERSGTRTKVFARGPTAQSRATGTPALRPGTPRARDRRRKRVYRERRRVAKAEARGLFRLFVSLSLTTLSCLVLRVVSLKFCAFFRRNQVKRIQSV